jgi:hypothetical protein
MSARNKEGSNGITIDGMIEEAVGRYDIDFPRADFLAKLRTRHS